MNASSPSAGTTISACSTATSAVMTMSAEKTAHFCGTTTVFHFAHFKTVYRVQVVLFSGLLW